MGDGWWRLGYGKRGKKHIFTLPGLEYHNITGCFPSFFRARLPLHNYEEKKHFQIKGETKIVIFVNLYNNK
jgi:hypothetical protein